MLIDLFALILAGMAVWKGFRKGLVVAVFSFLAYFIGLAAALKLSAYTAYRIGETISITQRWLPFLAFAAVFILTVFLVKLGAGWIQRAVSMMMLGWVNRLGGMLFFLLIYAFLYSIILFFITQLHIIKPGAVESSVTYPVLLSIAPGMLAALNTILPFFSDVFTSLLEFFEGVSPGEHPAQY